MKKFKKLIGLPIAEFEAYVKPTNKDLKPEILVRPANLIPTLKVGDEMALTSIFLTTTTPAPWERCAVFHVHLSDILRFCLTSTYTPAPPKLLNTPLIIITFVILSVKCDGCVSLFWSRF